MKLARASLALIALTATLAAPASAHQPVNLNAIDAKVESSQILVDGTVSWAIYVNFSKAGQTRHLRFALKEGDSLKAEYLIFDRRPENTLRPSQLPVISIKAPSGGITRLPISERTNFYEPFSGQNYLYLSRISKSGEAGIYNVTIRSKRAASIVLAIGSREVRGEVLQVGAAKGNCPKPSPVGVEIPIDEARQLIGSSERAAEVCALVNRWVYRVAQRDGEDFPMTRDYRLDRINVNINGGVITEITVG